MNVGHGVNSVLTHFRKYTERIGEVLREVQFNSLFSLSFLVWPLPIHRSSWRLLFDLIAFNDTHTVGRTPLDDRTARHRDLYLITHSTQKSQTTMPLKRCEPAVPASVRPLTPCFRSRGHRDRPVRLPTTLAVSMKVTFRNFQISTCIIELLRRMFVVPISSVFYAQSYETAAS